MRNRKPNSGQNIVYVDYSSSALGPLSSESSSVPTSFANILRDAVIVIEIPQRTAETDQEQPPRKPLT